MSLVDYAASDDDDDDLIGDQHDNTNLSAAASNPPPPPSQNRNFIALSDHSSHSVSNVSPLPPPSLESLPDASALLASPSMSSQQITGHDHASRVAAARAESASRKRDSNGSTSTLPHSKYPRGRFPHSRNVPDTAGGLLIPPQLRGRSNVATEDVDKLFVRRRSESSS